MSVGDKKRAGQHSRLVTHVSRELGFGWDREEMAVQRGKWVEGEKNQQLKDCRGSTTRPPLGQEAGKNTFKETDPAFPSVSERA